jgi:transposase-like protein
MKLRLFTLDWDGNQAELCRQHGITEQTYSRWKA